ncbi:PAAR-like domain-containing protein [Rahnella selenatireducens]|uniref:PAAR-like domain-containing protein n=1 Tax=Rahnella selenatireducens TaxID=3389797 RepID=UPI003967E484
MAEKHIGSQESQYRVISIAPDVCMVGITAVPFDSFQDLSHQKSYVTNVRARGKPILTVGCEIAGTQSNAGKGISSGTSLGSGDCTIMTGVPHIKCKGKPVARQDSLVAMNNGNTVGKLYTQVNPANGEIPVTGTLSLWDMMGEAQVQQAEAEMEAARQMPDVLEGMGKGFINGWYMLGHMLGKAGMLNGTIEAEQQMAMMNTMGMNTSSMEAASELNKAVLEETDTSERLMEMENEAQEVGANIEAGLELLFLVKGLTQGAAKLIGRGGRSGFKVVDGRNIFIDGKWFDPNGLPLPVPPSLSAAGRVPIVLQTGGHTLSKNTAKILNEQFGTNLTSREWGRALESLKKDNGLRNDFHGRILDNGSYIDDAGSNIGNIEDYLP